MLCWDSHSTQVLVDEATIGVVAESKLAGIPFWGTRVLIMETIMCFIAVVKSLSVCACA